MSSFTPDRLFLAVDRFRLENGLRSGCAEAQLNNVVIRSAKEVNVVRISASLRVCLSKIAPSTEYGA